MSQVEGQESKVESYTHAVLLEPAYRVVFKLHAIKHVRSATGGSLLEATRAVTTAIAGQSTIVFARSIKDGKALAATLPELGIPIRFGGETFTLSFANEEAEWEQRLKGVFKLRAFPLLKGAMTLRGEVAEGTLSEMDTLVVPLSSTTIAEFPVRQVEHRDGSTVVVCDPIPADEQRYVQELLRPAGRLSIIAPTAL
ncbi:MAG: hypothetical protein AAF624_00785 [Bacteroidota bacterium]